MRYSHVSQGETGGVGVPTQGRRQKYIDKYYTSQSVWQTHGCYQTINFDFDLVEGYENTVIAAAPHGIVHDKKRLLLRNSHIQKF